MQLGVERRRSVRLRREGSVEYTPYAVLVPRLEEVSRRGAVVDVSADEQGMSFLTGHPLFTGRRLQLVSSGRSRLGVVRWVSAAPVGYRAGVELGVGPFAVHVPNCAR